MHYKITGPIIQMTAVLLLLLCIGSGAVVTDQVASTIMNTNSVMSSTDIASGEFMMHRTLLGCILQFSIAQINQKHFSQCHRLLPNQCQSPPRLHPRYQRVVPRRSPRRMLRRTLQRRHQNWRNLLWAWVLGSGFLCLRQPYRS